MCQEELAWAAGLFDGEGGTYMHQPNKRWRGTPVIKMSQTDPFVLERLRDVLGVGSVRGPVMPKRPNCKPVWHWNCTRTEDTIRALKAMWPWLSPQKRTQALVVLERWANQPPAKAGRGIYKDACVNGHPYDDVYLDEDGKRRCYACRREAANRRYAAKKGGNVKVQRQPGPRRHVRTAVQG